MKRFLICICVLCLLLTGCQSAHIAPSEGTVSAGTTAAGTVSDGTAGTTLPDYFDSGAGQLGPTPLPTNLPPMLEIRLIETAGKLRLPYAGNQSSIQYITAPDQLPDEEALTGYDEAYFQDHALLLIIETVGSGSVRLEAHSFSVLDGVASVTLSHELDGDVGTADMATWMLWVELEAGLDYSWELDNPALPSDTVTE
jgi:opacity protein-like surface antigen